MEGQAGYRQARWSLRELLTSTEKAAIEEEFKGLERWAATLEAMRPLLKPDMGLEDFMAALKALESFAEKAARTGGYAALWFSENTQDEGALAFMGRVEQFLTELQNRTMFFDLWWRGLDETAAERLAAVSGDLRYYLQKQRLFARHTLSEPEERAIALKDSTGSNALGAIYDIITNKFVFELEVEGEKKRLPRDALAVYVRHRLPGVREAAYREQFRVYAAESAVLSQIYTYRVRDWANENLGLRGFDSPIAARNLSNDIPDNVVDTLLNVCRQEAGVFHRYFRLKAALLCLPRLRRFDIYAPLEEAPARSIPYEEASRRVLDAIGGFSVQMRAHAERVLDEGHVDSEIRPAKRGGAFCMSVLPFMSPWVLLNYTGEPRQAATLAHELGHAIHSLMAAQHSVLAFHPALPLAETASVFSEMLLTESLLSDEKDSAVRRSLVTDVLDDAYATVLRQAFFVLFEKEAHRAVRGGCTAEELNGIYLDNLSVQFGGSVEVDEIFKREWTGIPHIYHTPFYCYAYSFGHLLSLSLYQRYREHGENARESLHKILSYGGSESPGRILAEAGIDMADPGFWRGGFRLIEAMVGELEKPDAP